MAKVDNSQELLAFLMEKAGGEDVVYQQFYGEQLGDLASQDLTLKEVRDVAKEGGWLAMLDGMRITAIANIINPPHTTPSTPVVVTSSKRLTKDKIAQVRDEVLAHLKENPWLSKIEIADAIGFENKKLGPQLKVLRDEEQLISAGEKAGMKYALKGEKTKPPQ